MTKMSKPTIETMINTAALTLTSFAVVTLTQNTDGWEHFTKAFILLFAGMALEWSKYYGRHKKLWK